MWRCDGQACGRDMKGRLESALASTRTLGLATSVEELTPSTSINPANPTNISSIATNITTSSWVSIPTASTQRAKAEGDSRIHERRSCGAFYLPDRSKCFLLHRSVGTRTS